MKRNLAYDGPEGAAFHLPDEAEVVDLAPRGAATPRPLETAVREALDRPDGTPPLERLVAQAERVLLLVDDATRTTPVADILPLVDERLARAGIEDEQVDVLVALGTHRPMREDELAHKLGAFARRWRVHQHDHLSDTDLVDLGVTGEGMPVVVNRLVTECDITLGIGSVGVHAILGYSGGAKILFPGAAGAASEAWTHNFAAAYEREDLLGVMENPVRRAIEEGARKAGLDAVLNVVPAQDSGVLDAAFGDIVIAHRRCAQTARSAFIGNLNGGPVDIVVTDSRPADRDLWQAIKGLYCADVCVKEGGSVILATPAPEGVADNHPILLDLSLLTAREIQGLVEAGAVDDPIGAAVATYLSQMRDRASLHIVSSGIDADEAAKLGLHYHESLQEAVDAAVAEQNARPRIAVVHHAGALLPVVDARNRATILHDA